VTVNDLFALPVGTRINWPACDLSGSLIERRGNCVRILWSDGDVMLVARDDEDAAELAAGMEPIAEADEPAVVYCTA
jgi:hypothetical protein